jgi:hypothetical protein
MAQSKFSAKGAVLEGMETRGAGIAHDLSFRLAGGFREILERWGQVGEVAHWKG